MTLLHLFTLFAGAAALAIVPASQNEASLGVRRRQVPPSHVVHERQPESWGSRWTRRDRVPGHAKLPMRIGLKQDGLDHGHNRLMEISDPASPHYGKHMSAEEVIEMFAPPPPRVEAVVNWLTEAGISSERISHSANKQWIQFDAEASEVEDLLHTDFYFWEHGPTGSYDLACSEYHVPGHLVEHIDYLTPGIRMRRDPRQVAKLKGRAREEKMSKRRVFADNTGFMTAPTHQNVNLIYKQSLLDDPFNSSTCWEVITNTCIRNQYGIPKGTKKASGNQLGVFESLNDHFVPNDLNLYWANLYPDIPAGTYPVEKLIDGATGAALQSQDQGVESNLDFMAAMPLVYPQKTILFQTEDEYYEILQHDPVRGSQYPGFWNNFYDAIDGSYCTFSAYGETGNCVDAACKDPSYPDKYGYGGALQCGVYKPTNVISISYGGGEDDVPGYYSKRQCAEIMKLGLQGTTVVISSGDYGVGEQQYCLGTDQQIFEPQVDATCPYVLSVGSTEFDNATAADGTNDQLYEISTTQFGSGGGFSNVFPAPDYQADVVKNYIAQSAATRPFGGYPNASLTAVNGNFSKIPPGALFNTDGRGYPDVSAIGENFLIVFRSQLGTIGGTSLSAPVWAAILNRINEERIAVGKGPVGFVNPTLYAHPEVLNDVTQGANPGCSGNVGFTASTGWDPVSGLGTPNYPKLLSLFLSLP